MKADQIIKNVKVYTSDRDRPLASALAVKDGKFIYVGDEAGLSAYEGPVTDLGGGFIMPGIIDSHVHVTWPIGFEYATIDGFIDGCGRQEALDIMSKVIAEKPGLERYRFIMEKKTLRASPFPCATNALGRLARDTWANGMRPKGLALGGFTYENPPMGRQSTDRARPGAVGAASGARSRRSVA